MNERIILVEVNERWLACWQGGWAAAWNPVSGFIRRNDGARVMPKRDEKIRRLIIGGGRFSSRGKLNFSCGSKKKINRGTNEKSKYLPKIITFA